MINHVNGPHIPLQYEEFDPEIIHSEHSTPHRSTQDYLIHTSNI